MSRDTEILQTLKDALPKAIKVVFDQHGSNKFGTPDDLDLEELRDYLTEQDVIIEAVDKMVLELLEGENSGIFLKTFAEMYFDHKAYDKAQRLEHENMKAEMEAL